MLSPSQNGIDIREMPQRFEEALRTISEIRMFLGLNLGPYSEIPLAHKDGTPLSEEERDALLTLLNRRGPGDDVYALTDPVRRFVDALKCGLSTERTQETTAGGQIP